MTHESVDFKSDIQNGTKLGKSESDRLLGDVAGEFFDRISRGEQPQVDDYAQRYPQIAELIREMFPIIPQIDDSLQASEPSKKSVIEFSGQQRFGDFRILHQLGSGGMGVVYEAEQISMGRHVALKILPMAGALQQKQLLRFRNEVRAAAMLDHPHIVSVYSIGEERGVHYYTMQLIRGQSLAEVIQDLRLVRDGDGPQRDGLTGDSIHQVLSVSKDRSASAKGSADQPTEEYSSKSSATPHNDQAVDATLANTPPPLAADTHPEVKGQISTAANTSKDHGFFRSAAKLGIQAAEALQHAHDLGVLHRDIKPGNLMLDADAQLHITDFGLARIEADAGVTMTGDILGTLRYMSPEQALAKRVVIDQRSDIYSLGVTLYELLTLQPAFSGNDRQSLLQQIAFEEPKLPTRINRAIPRELETIVMKAIAKNPRERYATAQELADDLGRYLDDMPIQAKRPSLLQRTNKWTHRNKTFVRTAVATVAIALLIGGSLLWQQRSETLAALEQAKTNEVLAKQNAEQAELEAATSKAVIEFLQVDLLGKVRPSETPDPNVKLRTILDRAATEIQGKFDGQPLVEAAIRDTIGQAYHALGAYRLAEPHRTRAVELARSELGDTDALSLVYSARLGRLLNSLGRYEEAKTLLQQTLESQQRILGKEHPDTLRSIDNLAMFYSDQRYYDQAEKLHLQTLEIRKRTLGEEHPSTLGSINGLANVYLRQQRHDQAEKLHLQVLEIRKRTLGEEHPSTAASMYNLGMVYADEFHRIRSDQGQNDQAEKLILQSLEINTRTLGEEHPSTLNSMHELAVIYSDQGKYDQAEKLFLQTLEICKRTLGEEHPDTLASMNNLGVVYMEQGQNDQAEKLHLQTLEIKTRTLGEEHPSTAGNIYNLGWGYAGQTRWKDATVNFAKAAELNPDHIEAWYLLAVLQLHAKDSAGYRSTCAAILEQFADSESTLKSFLAAWTCSLAPDAVDDYSLAIDLARRAVESDPSSAMYAAILGNILHRAGKYEQSLVHHIQAGDLGNPVPASPIIGEPALWFWIAMTHHKLGHDAEARQLLTKAIARTNEILDQESEAYKSLLWSDRLWFEALRDEAIGLIGTSSSKSNDSADL